MSPKVVGTQPVTVSTDLGRVLLFSPEVQVEIGARVHHKAHQGPGGSHLHNPIGGA